MLVVGKVVMHNHPSLVQKAPISVDLGAPTPSLMERRKSY
jgi:hypothetical protein